MTDLLEFTDFELAGAPPGVWHQDAFLCGLIAGLAGADAENKYAADPSGSVWFDDGQGLGLALRSLARRHWRETEES